MRQSSPLFPLVSRKIFVIFTNLVPWAFPFFNGKALGTRLHFYKERQMKDSCTISNDCFIS